MILDHKDYNYNSFFKMMKKICQEVKVPDAMEQAAKVHYCMHGQSK